MKRSAPISALSLWLVALPACLLVTGCASHAAKLAIVAAPTERSALFQRVVPVIAAVLHERGFMQDSPARIRDDLRIHHPEAASWSGPDRNDSPGVTVWALSTRRGVDILFDAESGSARPDLIDTQEAMQAQLAAQFPELVIESSSWKYLKLR